MSPRQGWLGLLGGLGTGGAVAGAQMWLDGPPPSRPESGVIFLIGVMFLLACAAEWRRTR